MPGKKEGEPAKGKDAESRAEMRRKLANYCRWILHFHVEAAGGEQKSAEAGLPPRARQTFARLLAGDSEKQAAIRLGVSRHTVHVYVKAIYRHFKVSSRGELLARFVEGAHRAPENNKSPK